MNSSSSDSQMRGSWRDLVQPMPKVVQESTKAPPTQNPITTARGFHKNQECLYSVGTELAENIHEQLNRIVSDPNPFTTAKGIHEIQKCLNIYESVVTGFTHEQLDRIVTDSNPLATANDFHNMQKCLGVLESELSGIAKSCL